MGVTCLIAGGHSLSASSMPKRPRDAVCLLLPALLLPDLLLSALLLPNGAVLMAPLAPRGCSRDSAAIARENFIVVGCKNVAEDEAEAEVAVEVVDGRSARCFLHRRRCCSRSRSMMPTSIKTISVS